MNEIKELIAHNERYANFVILEKPVPFNELQKDVNIDIVQTHSLTPCGENDIVGFCGQFSWKNNNLTSIDYDTYDETMLVYGYEWFDNEEAGITKGLDILVKEW